LGFMTEPVIQVRDLSKCYQIRSTVPKPYHSLREDLVDGFKGLLRGQWGQTASEDFWALKDISFDVHQGEVVGIIGRNGAGKSTLLKILSRIVRPTSGEAIIRGRVGSLLEVGTGFHPELTGRENIFMNGAILGMKRAEIVRKFDEIVAFAEVEKFLDTPVKFYSSGMYVRLAFAVAAHLEPEILIVDEVLAVGDAQFQKKCLGKMENVSRKEGKTVLFVSHQMSMISSLCQRVILLELGSITISGSPSDAILSYYDSESKSSLAYVDFTKRSQKVGDNYAQLLECYIKNSKDELVSDIDIEEEIKIGIRYKILSNLEDSLFSTYPQININTSRSELAFISMPPNYLLKSLGVGEYIAECILPSNFFNSETYFVDVGLATCQTKVIVHFYQSGVMSFHVSEIIEKTLYTTRNGFANHIPGVVRPQLNWEIKEVG